MNHWLKIFSEISAPKSIREEVIKNTVSSDRLDSSEHNVIIIFSFEFALECFIGFIHFNKLLVSLLIIHILFRMILESLLSVGIFNLLKSSSSWNPQYGVVTIER